VTNPINIGNVTNTTASGTGEVGATISVMASDFAFISRGYQSD
jgi:hypothetical protein